MTPHNPIKKRIGLRPEMTIAEVLKRFPHTRMVLAADRWPIDPVRDGHLTLREYADSLKVCYAFDTYMTSVNNCAVMFDQADRQVEGDPVLMDYQAYHRVRMDQSPEQKWKGPSVAMDQEGTGLVCDGGLPYPRWVVSDGLNAVRLQQEGQPIEMLTAFQRVAGMSQEHIFDNGFMDLSVDGQRHRFDQVHLTFYGYENHLKSRPEERSRLFMYRDRLWLSLSCPGTTVSWVVDDNKMVPRTTGTRTITRHGWDETARCLVFQTVDDRPNLVRKRPDGYNDFDDDTVREFIGADWSESIQGAAPKHTECWVAIGGDDAVCYSAGSPDSRDAGHPGLHTFSGKNAGCLFIALGSTRQGALAELEAAREGFDLPLASQERRYRTVARRCPRLEIEGHPLLTETAVMIPQFLESLKTGFVLMRSRPHDGAITGGWDQVMITAPMMRAGDDEMPPRYLEHWLHQFQLDGQLFHVCDFDLSPAMMYRRWDTDDFVYLIAAAQWVAHTGDRSLLERLAFRCTHMLRVMLRDADPEVGLIPTRGVFPDWPPLEIGRKGVTYPAMEMGLWYEALRWWEGLAEQLGEKQLTEKIRLTAEKIRSRYLSLYYDPEAGALCDAVFPKTLDKVRSFPTFALTPYHGCFGHELLDGIETSLAERLLNEHIDLKFPGIRIASPGEFPTVFEHVQWPLFDHLVAKTLRRGNSKQGLNAYMEVIERQYRWLHCACESLNMYYDLTNEDMSKWTNWFGWSAGGWYEALLSGIAGIWEEPGGLVYVPADMTNTVKLTNLPYRGGTWNITVSGRGSWVGLFRVNGEDLAGICKVPERYLQAGQHTLEIQRSESQPETPYILDSVGLRLLGTTADKNELRVSFAGPGRSRVRLYCRRRPKVFDNTAPVKVEWNSKTGIAWLEVKRGVAGGELVIT